VDRGVSRGQRGGSLTAVNLSFLDRLKIIYQIKKEITELFCLTKALKALQDYKYFMCNYAKLLKL
jgi:hypothetical protein